MRGSNYTRLQNHAMHQVSQVVTLPPPAKFPMFPSSHIVILFTHILVAIPTGQLLLARGTVGCLTVKDNLDKNRRVGRNETAGLSTVKSTTRQHQVGCHFKECHPHCVCKIMYVGG